MKRCDIWMGTAFRPTLVPVQDEVRPHPWCSPSSARCTATERYSGVTSARHARRDSWRFYRPRLSVPEAAWIHPSTDECSTPAIRSSYGRFHPV